MVNSLLGDPIVAPAGHGKLRERGIMKTLVYGLILFSIVSLSQAAVNPIISSGPNSAVQAQPSSPVDLLSQDQMAQGLREALNKAVQHAVADLGHYGGFLTNLQVRIPMPQKLQTVEKTLRTFGESQLADEFVATMNHAAEQAVPQATTVFMQAVQHMTIADAKTILTGPDDAATQYFRRVTETNLYQRFLPIVKSATDSTGVTSTYKRLLGTMGQNKYLGPLEGILLNNDTVDIDRYVTEHALNGLFKMMAREETQIRRNPLERSSALLQRVFAIYNGAREAR